MDQVVAIGLDIAKSVFQVHGVDAQGGVVVRQRLTRSRMLAYFAKKAPCLVGIEACGLAHYWARELSKLGHEVRLIPPSYVKPYVKCQKNDMADAEAICEAVTRPSMRFVPVMRRWWAHMADIMMTHPDNEPVSWPLVEMFHLDWQPGGLGAGTARASSSVENLETRGASQDCYAVSRGCC